jgi:hypothetical protein
MYRQVAGVNRGSSETEGTSLTSEKRKESREEKKCSKFRETQPGTGKRVRTNIGTNEGSEAQRKGDGCGGGKKGENNENTKENVQGKETKIEVSTGEDETGRATIDRGERERGEFRFSCGKKEERKG